MDREETLRQLEEHVDTLHNADSPEQRHAAHQAIGELARRVASFNDAECHGNKYVHEKLAELAHHAAVLARQTDSGGHSLFQHASWARGVIQRLRVNAALNRQSEPADKVHISDAIQAYGLAELLGQEALDEIQEKLLSRTDELANATLEQRKAIVRDVLHPIRDRVLADIERIRRQA